MSNIESRILANTMVGKTARACDGCLRKRARWYCTADDAFLCQACEVSVHSANQLASRHERVRLRTSSSSSFSSSTKMISNTWHQGFTRKARTPRQNNNKPLFVKQQEGITVKDSHEKHKILDYNKECPLPFVPEIGSDQDQEPNYIIGGSNNNIIDEDEQDLLFRVPVFDFDPFEEEMYEVVTGDHVGTRSENDGHNVINGLQGFLPAYTGLVEFNPTEVELDSLLCGEVGEDSSTNEIKNFGVLLDSKEEDSSDKLFIEENLLKVVKEEEEVEEEVEEAFNDFKLDQVLQMAIDDDQDQFPVVDWNNLSYESLANGEKEEEEEKIVVPQVQIHDDIDGSVMKKNIKLRINYEAVISAWASQGSPWAKGIRPELNFMDTIFPKDEQPDTQEGMGSRGHNIIGDEGREARVMRYKEKRRTRLFSKKIRYQVRKLNADMRPRLKGRFVKRT